MLYKRGVMEIGVAQKRIYRNLWCTTGVFTKGKLCKSDVVTIGVVQKGFA